QINGSEEMAGHVISVSHWVGWNGRGTFLFLGLFTKNVKDEQGWRKKKIEESSEILQSVEDKGRKIFLTKACT
ncbi:6823_t:CDS:2, partial [Scutellospora calospora]